MPKRELLEKIKDSIQNIGNEKNQTIEKNLPFNDTDIPGEINVSENMNEKKEGQPDEDLMSSIMEDSGKEFEERETTGEEKGFDLGLEDFENMEQSIESSGEEKNSNELDDILEKISDNQDGMEENSSKELNELLGESSEMKEEPEGGLKELDALFGDTSMYSEKDTENKGFEEFNIEPAEEPEGPVKIDEALADLAGDFKDESFDEIHEASTDNILENLGKEDEQIQGASDLDSLLKTIEGGTEEFPEEQFSEEIEPFDIKENLTEEPRLEENFFPEEKIEEDTGAKDEEKKFDLDELGDLSGFEIETKDEKEGAEETSKDKFLEEADEIGSFDFESLESLSSSVLSKEEEQIPIFKEEVEPLLKEKKEKFSDSSVGKIPEELSDEELRNDRDVELSLTQDERKQILITLTGLPKDAEIKIANAIVSGKYSNQQLRPLINSLIDKESPTSIIRYYEKITHDTSLAHISGIKYAGLKFEERQKTLSYILQKNLFPLLSIFLIAGILFLGSFFLFFRVISPTIEASTYYNRAKKNLDNKVFWDVEKDFEKGFDIQPRYREVVYFARGYRKYKRYLEAEKKYELAYNMRPDKIDLALEYADFFREKKDFERSARRYKDILNTNPKNISAMLGLAKDYFDWSGEQETRLHDAKETYYDVLDLDKNNREAIYGNLNIFIRENDYKDVMKYYFYIEKNFSNKKVDPLTYANLAEYFINIGEVDNVKNVIERASKSLKKDQLLPQLDYQFARYDKLLNVFDEERSHLENALKQFEFMKEIDNDEYNSPESQKLLARVYNDMGENYEKFESTSVDAEEYYKKAINTDPDLGRAYYNLANFNFKYKTDKDGYLIAKENYELAERKGFTNDTLNFNLGWLYYKDKDYDKAYRRIISILDLNENNSNLKFMLGTIYYKMGNYDLAESLLLETYIHLDDLSQRYYPLEIDVKEDKMIMEMQTKITNNLGAVYQKKYEETRKSNYLITATKYYSESINFFNKLQTELGVENPNEPKSPANINLRMVLYPYAGVEEPQIYEDFPVDFKETI